jgi:predicted benzoate:H+ symporter BenE
MEGVCDATSTSQFGERGPQMAIRSLAARMCAGALLCAGSPVLHAYATDPVGSARIIPAWYTVARTAPATPVQLSRVLAMVHAAMHDAVNGADPRYEAYASDLTDRNADAEAAAAGAVHRVLSRTKTGA